MCGIAGIINRDQQNFCNLQAELESMLHQIEHRGPNDQGIWVDESHKFGFAHRRLSILDLSMHGSQPMQSQSKNYTISYNGEIYNHLELRKDLGFPPNFWRGTSDTETLLACIEKWGLINTLKKVHGMFAFALWSQAHKKVFLCRDRFGEKPLYFGWESEKKKQFLFASELQAFKPLAKFDQKLNINYIDRFLKTNNFGGDQTIFEQIYKVLPGSYIEVDLISMSYKASSYWSSYEQALIAKSNLFNGTYKDAIDELDSLLHSVIKDQMISDVPVGCFLSGGLDSSLIASIMAANSIMPINTFSIGQPGLGNEAEKAKNIAYSIGSNHTEQYIDSEIAINLIPEIFNFYGEPFADSSQIPTYLVSKLAKGKVTVALSGDAGDEIFGGYNRYEYAERYWPLLNSIPRPIRSLLSKHAKSLSSLIIPASNFIGIDSKWENISLKLQKMFQSIDSKDIYELHDALMAPSHLLIKESFKDKSYKADINPVFNDSKFKDFEKLMIADMDSYLSDDILVKVDRAAMRNSLETRVPFLDHRIFEFMWSLPPEYKINKGKTKAISRSVLANYISTNLTNQPKTGFGVPLAEWLSNPLKHLATDILFGSALSRLEIIDTDAVKILWKDHIEKKSDNSDKIWSLISLGFWLENN